MGTVRTPIRLLRQRVGALGILAGHDLRVLTVVLPVFQGSILPEGRHRALVRQPRSLHVRTMRGSRSRSRVCVERTLHLAVMSHGALTGLPVLTSARTGLGTVALGGVGPVLTALHRAREPLLLLLQRHVAGLV
jgi:hypothetical protein